MLNSRISVPKAMNPISIAYFVLSVELPGEKQSLKEIVEKVILSLTLKAGIQ